MNGIIWTYQEIDPDFRQLFCGEKHQRGHALPVAATNARHVARKRERMHRDLGMSVRAELLGTLNADGPIAKSCAFGRAGHNADMLRHDCTLRTSYALRITAERCQTLPDRANRARSAA